jgi:hypothetical protein
MQPLLEPFQLFTHKECDDIIRRAQDQLTTARTTSGYDASVRSNSVAWLEFEDQGRFYDLMTGRTDVPARWLQHPYQVSRYDTGEFYDWHEDLIPSEVRSSIRSLTLTCTLEPAPGAGIEFENHQPVLEKGWAVMFDAQELHRATAPTQGTRWALTVWAMRDNPKKREASAPKSCEAANAS